MSGDDDSRGPARRGPIEARQSLRLRLTLLSTALLALFGALLLALSYLVVGRVVAALPQFPPGTFVEVNGRLIDASAAAAAIAAQGRQTVLIAGLIAFPIQVLAGAMLSWLLIGRTLRPLFTLTRTARVLSESSLDSRIRLTGPRDEVADLSDTFDDMLDRLQAAFDAERRFVANASHELRTPLSVIRTEVEVTLADPDADAAQLREMGAVVLEATDGANRLLTSLLVLARTQARGVSVRQEVDLAELVGPSLQVNQAAIAERGLSVNVATGPTPVSGDPALLGRLIGNLVENAVRHNVPGGWMTVTTGRGDEDGHGDSILEIASSGPVIDAATVNELFEPFRQGQRPRTGQRGTGLGLSIVRAVVAAHHGTVDAVPVPDGGLRVRVRLPPADPAPAAAE
jgi:signal transduction histidine kinase